jgi:hypothetical protein
MVAYVPEINETDTKKIVLALQQLAAGRSNADAELGDNRCDDKDRDLRAGLGADPDPDDGECRNRVRGGLLVHLVGWR